MTPQEDNPMPVTIRFAKEEDIPSILRLLTQVNRVP